MLKNKKTMCSWSAFGVLLACFLTVAALYFWNIIQWSDFTDQGFVYRTGSGFDIVGSVKEKGRAAGLQPGDRILKINGKPFSSMQERRRATHYRVGEANVYWIERAGKQFKITITNTRIGFKKVFFRSGLPFITGLAYLFIGVLVFFMKPHRHGSWAFFVFGVCFGLMLIFLLKTGFLKPAWLGTVNLLVFSFAPATVVHLALTFPEKRRLFERYPGILALPYIATLLLFSVIRSSASEMLAIPPGWYKVILAYLLLAVLGFLFSCIFLGFRSASEIVKMRSKCVLLGAFVAASVPILDLTTSSFFHVFIVPGFHYYLPFIVFFPICVVYAIIKHNLFEIQTTVRRTFGYILTTLSVVVLYTLLVFVPVMTFGKKGFAEYPAIAIAGIVGIIFIVNFFRKRVQRVVDRVFYRMEYEYRQILEKIGEAMRTSLTLDQIVTRMMDIIFNSLFIEKGYVMLKTKVEKLYVSVLHKEPLITLPAEDPFIRIVREKKKGITRYDIAEDPVFQENREAVERLFDRLEATLVIPILFEDRLFGLLVLGEKKSGRFYKREDILLLDFLTDQAAVAMENARLQQAHVEALEMSKKELEQLNKAKSKTLDLLSHELKTPLSVIAGSVKILQRESGENEDPQRRNKVFRRMEAHLNRLYDIQESIDKTIRFHRESERRTHPEAAEASARNTLESIELYPFAQRMLAEAREKAGPREISFELRGTENLSVAAHLMTLEDAVASLLRNAAENTPDEGLIRILLEKSDNEVLFKVKDFGVGITDEDRNHLFNAFYHTRETDRYATLKPYDFNAGGRGLSLFRIRSRAEQFGFGLFMNSKRCRFLSGDLDSCPGRISLCPCCNVREDCLASGGSSFWLVFPAFQ